MSHYGFYERGKRPVVALRSGVDGCWRPVPRQEIIETLHGMAFGHALEHVFEVGVGLDVVELCRGDEGADRCPSHCAAIGAGEQMVLAPERHLWVILPKTGRLRWFTIAGTLCSGGLFAGFTVSGAHRVSWFTSRWNPASSWRCLAGCSIL